MIRFQWIYPTDTVLYSTYICMLLRKVTTIYLVNFNTSLHGDSETQVDYALCLCPWQEQSVIKHGF